MEPLILSIESLAISNASACQEEWLAAMSSGDSEMLVDVGRLANIDSAGLQLLLSLQKEASLRGKKFSIRGGAAVIREKAATVGIAQLLCWEA